MDNPLDQVRAQAGLKPSAGSPGTRAGRSAARRPAVARAGRRPARALRSRTRWFLAVSTVLAAAVAVFHRELTGLAYGHGSAGILALTVVDWPTPLVQRDVSAAAAVALLVLALLTRGYSRVGRALRWPLRLAATAAVLGAGPAVLVCAIIVAAFALMIAIAVAVVIALIAVLFAVT